MKKKIIAVFGGSFNPPTNAHVNLAKQILKEYKDIDRIIFVPVSTKYNKKGLASDIDRYNLLKKICKNNNKLEVSSIEIDSSRQLYTIETLEKLQNQNLNYEICFLLGTDNLKEFETWHAPEEIVSKFRILVLQRDNDNINKIINNSKLLTKYETSLIILKNISQIDLSASYIRERIKNGEDIKELVPQEIYQDIKKIYKN